MKENAIVKLTKHLDVTDLAGEKVMIDFSTGKYFLLKGVANDIWDILSAGLGVNINAITSKLVREYEIDEKTCAESVTDFINHLYELKFVEFV